MKHALECLAYLIEQAKAGVAVTGDGDVNDIELNAKVVIDQLNQSNSQTLLDAAQKLEDSGVTQPAAVDWLRAQAQND